MVKLPPSGPRVTSFWEIWIVSGAGVIFWQEPSVITDSAERNAICRNFCFICFLFVVCKELFDYRYEVTVSVSVVYPCACRPELVVTDPLERVCCQLAGIGMCP